MRLCVPMGGFFRGVDMKDAIATVARLGYNTIEMGRWPGLDLPGIRAACEDNGVELASMIVTEFRMTDPFYRKLWLEKLEECCKAANRAGAKRLITQVGQDLGIDRARQHESIVSALREAKPILEETGVMIMIEPLNLYVNHPGYYLWSSVEAFQIIREVNHPLVKVVYDIYHQQVMEGNIIPSIVNNLDCIGHLHAAGHPGRIELQFGESNYKYIFQKVDEAGYTGACGLEYGPTLDPIESLKEAMRIYGKT